MRIDMHIHTTCSDGGSTPEEIIGMARSINLEAIAITDHDTLAGIKPALYEGLAKGVEVIPGVELGSYLQGEEIHILGYLVDINDRLFIEELEILRKARIQRMEKMVKKLQELGFDVTMGMIMDISQRGSMGRPHLARAMIKIGAVKTIYEAFERYLGEGRPAYIPRHKMAPVEAVTLIKSAGGAPVLAHPGLNRPGFSLEDLIKAGLVGIEADHPSHSPEQTTYFKQLARQKGLITTGGSDYHSPEQKDGNRFGAITVPFSVVEKLKKRVAKTNKYGN